MRSRFVLGIGILLALLLAGFGGSYFLQEKNEPVAAALTQAREKALAEDVEGALELALKAEDAWRENWHPIAAMADHDPMDEIDSLFEQLQVYGSVANSTELAAYCARLAQRIRAVSEAHMFSWWNLL